MEQKEKPSKFLRKAITRRQAIKLGGIAAVGLVFSKPIIETIRPEPTFANANYADATAATAGGTA